MGFWGRQPPHVCDLKEPTIHGCGGHHTQNPWWGLKCWRCFGVGSLSGQRCDHCNGTGLVAMTQCPVSANTGEMTLMFDAWRWLKDKQTFPVTGALYDQSNFFVSACEFLNGMSATYEHEAQQIAFQKVNKNGTK